MWQYYYSAIFKYLFLPFILYLVSFIAYTCFFSQSEADEFSLHFVSKIICLVAFGKTFITFFILEMIQIKNDGMSYIEVWNMIDLASLFSNALYFFGELTDTISYENL